MEKRVKFITRSFLIGLAILLVFISAGFYFNYPNKYSPSSSEDVIVISLKDVAQNPVVIKPPKTKKELKELRRKIVQFDFPECMNIKEVSISDEKFSKCFVRVWIEASKIGEIENTQLVPELIKIAKRKMYSPPPKLDILKLGVAQAYQQTICWMRFQAIKALGELRDPRAVEPLLDLLNEGYSPNGCVMGEFEREPELICFKAAKALGKINPKGLAEKIYAEAESYKQSIRPTKRTITGSNFGILTQEEMKFMCKMYAVVELEEGREILLEKIKSKDLEKRELILYIGLLSSKPLTREGIEILKSYLSHQDPEVRKEAAKALVQFPTEENLELYLWMFENGFPSQAFSAFRKLKSPQLIPFLVELLKKDGWLSEKSAWVLQTYPSDLVKEKAVPVIREKIKNREAEWLHYRLLVFHQACSAIPELEEILYCPECDKSYIIDTIGMIRCKESQEALKRLISDVNYVEKMVKLSYKSKPYRDKEIEKLSIEGRRQSYSIIRDEALYWFLEQMSKEGLEEEGLEYAKKYFPEEKVLKVWKRIIREKER